MSFWLCVEAIVCSFVSIFVMGFPIVRLRYWVALGAAPLDQDSSLSLSLSDGTYWNIIKEGEHHVLC